LSAVRAKLKNDLNRFHHYMQMLHHVRSSDLGMLNDLVPYDRLEVGRAFTIASSSSLVPLLSTLTVIDLQLFCLNISTFITPHHIFSSVLANPGVIVQTPIPHRLHHHVSVCNVRAINSHWETSLPVYYKWIVPLTKYCHYPLLCSVHYLSCGNGISNASLRTLIGAHTRTYDVGKSDVAQPDLSNECRVFCRLGNQHDDGSQGSTVPDLPSLNSTSSVSLCMVKETSL
jgi:hypothetical protein